ncbi:MAG: M23 family peptidase, partial [Pseudomonadota bacterium]|nr:M23 family peptidase [Pseudomonadota bacterium]
LAYRAPEVLNAGFSTKPVDNAAVENASTGGGPTAASPALIAWVRAIGLDAGDVQAVSITGPNGFAAENVLPALERPRAQQVLFTGRNNRAGRWPSGAYRARYTVRRRGQVVLEHAFQLAL